MKKCLIKGMTVIMISTMLASIPVVSYAAETEPKNLTESAVPESDVQNAVNTVDIPETDKESETGGQLPQEQPPQEQPPQEQPPAEIRQGWVTSESGTQYYIDNVYVVGEKKIDGYWYYFDANGMMATGWTVQEAKRKIIGEEFIRIFEEEAKKIGAVDFLAQGTIYPDVVESGLGGESAVIKSHHNVGGLPDFVDFKEIIEPLRDLFKDEVRKAGLELGIPERLVFRQPFPGPGLGIRIIGEVTEEKVRIVQDADFIYREEVDKAAADYKKEHGEEPSWMPNQYFAALTNMRSVGVMGDFRTYDYAVALRAVKTIDFMTAESAEIPYAVLNKVMNRIINEVKGVNRVFYDLTSKPPGTIEFE